MTSFSEPAPPVAPRQAKTRRRRVIDAPIRAFHWLFALSFAGAWLTAEGEHWRALHETLGYTMAGLLAFRLAYGTLGPRHAGLRPLLRQLAGAPAWLASLVQAARGGTIAGVAWSEGRNAAMAVAVGALLLLVLPLALSGYGIDGAWADAFGGDRLADLHEFLGDAFLAVVVGHLALIAGISLLRRRNQADAMLTGRVDGAGPDLVRDNRVWLGALLLAAVLAFVAWEWRQSPAGLVPASALTDFAQHRERDADD